MKKNLIYILLMCIILHISACSKISKIFFKETTEEVVENSSKATLQKLSKDVLQEREFDIRKLF